MARIGNILASLVIAAIFCGCGPPDDGISAENKKVMSDVSALAKKVDGDYTKLTTQEQKHFLNLAHGNPTQAKSLCYLIAHPPSEAFKDRQPGPPGTSPGN